MLASRDESRLEQKKSQVIGIVFSQDFLNTLNDYFPSQIKKILGDTSNLLSNPVSWVTIAGLLEYFAKFEEENYCKQNHKNSQLQDLQEKINKATFSQKIKNYFHLLLGFPEAKKICEEASKAKKDLERINETLWMMMQCRIHIANALTIKLSDETSTPLEFLIKQEKQSYKTRIESFFALKINALYKGAVSSNGVHTLLNVFVTSLPYLFHAGTHVLSSIFTGPAAFAFYIPAIIFTIVNYNLNDGKMIKAGLGLSSGSDLDEWMDMDLKQQEAVENFYGKLKQSIDRTPISDCKENMKIDALMRVAKLCNKNSEQTYQHRYSQSLPAKPAWRRRLEKTTHYVCLGLMIAGTAFGIKATIGIMCGLLGVAAVSGGIAIPLVLIGVVAAMTAFSIVRRGGMSKILDPLRAKHKETKEKIEKSQKLCNERIFDIEKIDQSKKITYIMPLLNQFKEEKASQLKIKAEFKNDEEKTEFKNNEEKVATQAQLKKWFAKPRDPILSKIGFFPSAQQSSAPCRDSDSSKSLVFCKS